MTNIKLNQLHARFFRDCGYLCLPNALSNEEIVELKDFVYSLQKERIVSATKFYQLYQRNPELIGRLVKHATLIQALELILGPNIAYVLNRHNHASINTSASTATEARLHRDILQPTRGMVTCVIYLEDASIINGCTHIIPGSHNLPFVGVPQPDGGGTWMDEHQEFEGFADLALPVPMAAGGILIFDSLAFHSVGRNTSSLTRASIALGFRSVDELDLSPDLNRLILVAGSFIYRGNDRNTQA